MTSSQAEVGVERENARARRPRAGLVLPRDHTRVAALRPTADAPAPPIRNYYYRYLKLIISYFTF